MRNVVLLNSRRLTRNGSTDLRIINAAIVKIGQESNVAPSWLLDAVNEELDMSDLALRQSVIDELEFEPSVDAKNIGVAVEKGIVTLTGHVSSFAEKVAAERVAQRVKGVRAIAQEIEVRYPEEKKTADDQIAHRIVSMFNWDVRVPEDAVHIKVQQGWVTLTGHVSWNYQRVAAESAVRRLSGVVGVSNMIEVKSGPQPQDVRTKILDALKRNAEFEVGGIRVVVNDNRVTLEGKIKDQGLVRA